MERRIFPRYQLVEPMTARIEIGGSQVSGQIKDISLGGARFVAPTQIDAAVGEKGYCQIDMPGSQLCIPASIASIGLSRQAGIRFLISDEDRASLQNHIDRLFNYNGRCMASLVTLRPSPEGRAVHVAGAFTMAARRPFMAAMSRFGVKRIDLGQVQSIDLPSASMCVVAKMTHGAEIVNCSKPVSDLFRAAEFCKTCRTAVSCQMGHRNSPQRDAARRLSVIAQS